MHKETRLIQPDVVTTKEKINLLLDQKIAYGQILTVDKLVKQVIFC